ncbi:hypothetical protein KPH14_000751 [Odynerus spinipes]|uniref:Reverse transcriptase n=1 Tax=Odynerus spinipes TaxID=1348599 RepID=A0AAD9VLC4_9HYME|nr:hypothetical protein KPH14_000751 [Odynerus spinipes]
MWSKNPCSCLRTILKDKSSANTPTRDIMVPFWTNVMTGGGGQSPGVEIATQVIQEMWKPIDPAEIKESLPEAATAPGPDGLTARQLRAVPLNILRRILNLFLLSGRLPKHLLESRTTLIPKKDGASEPGDFRPITVSSVLTRTFHKVLAVN